MTLTTLQRTSLVANARYLATFHDQIAYDQVRPFPVRALADIDKILLAGQELHGLDCSSFIIQVYRVVTGCKDPSGYSFDGYGNTESMLEARGHYSQAVNAHPGAIVIFNADLELARQHACMVTVQGFDPTVISHGGPGVGEMPLSEMQSAFTGKTVFLDVSTLG